MEAWQVAVEAAQGALVVEGEVVDADAVGQGGGLLGVEAEGLAAVGLGGDVADAAGGEAGVEGAPVVFADHRGDAQELGDGLERLLGDAVLVAVDAEYVEGVHAAHGPGGGRGVVAGTEVQVVGVDLLAGLGEGFEQA